MLCDTLETLVIEHLQGQYQRIGLVGAEADAPEDMVAEWLAAPVRHVDPRTRHLMTALGLR